MNSIYEDVIWFKMYSPIPEMMFYYEIDRFVDVFYKFKKNLEFITVWQ